MATVINNPPERVERVETVREGGSGVGTVVAAIILLLVLILFVAYGLPALRHSTRSSNVTVPSNVNLNVSGSVNR